MSTKLFAKFDLDFADNPKIIGLSCEAFRAFVEGVLYSRQHMTDGFLDGRVVSRKWGTGVAVELSENDPVNPSWVPVENGWNIHGFTDKQTSRAEIESRRSSGRLGGLAKAKHAATSSTSLAPASTLLEKTASKSLRETETETETETTKSVVPRKRGTRIPEPFMVTTEMREWAASRVPGVDVTTATEKFVNYWRASTKNATKLDWTATWNNWLLSDFERNAQGRKETPTDKTMAVLDIGRRLQAEHDRRELTA